MAFRQSYLVSNPVFSLERAIRQEAETSWWFGAGSKQCVYDWPPQLCEVTGRLRMRDMGFYTQMLPRPQIWRCWDGTWGLTHVRPALHP